MAVADFIRKLVGASPTVASIAAKIAELEARRPALIREKTQLEASARESFDDRKARSAARERRLEIEDDLRDLEILLPRLRQELANATAVHRAQRVSHYHAEMKRGADALETALRGVISANAAARKLYDNARAELGEEIMRSLPIVYFAAPVAVESVAQWRSVMDEYFVLLPKPSPIVRAEAPAPTKRAVAGSEFNGRVTLNDAVVAPLRAAARPPLREVAKEGDVLVEVLRGGYESPSGVQCFRGDIIAMPEGLANVAVQNAAVEFHHPRVELLRDVGPAA
ncbi:hypothetical protein QMZ05_27680 [Bradyrhizobium sp. INPA03-11B]|uniref:hypothetical protein n=1 Tax=Bradyrhizobium sp. INPA03-11B TaxID=418598 RepID=UPI00338DAC09